MNFKIRDEKEKKKKRKTINKIQYNLKVKSSSSWYNFVPFSNENEKKITSKYFRITIQIQS
jgi:hypothetical protein